MYNIAVFKMKELCRDVQDIDLGMCKSSQYEVQRKCAMYIVQDTTDWKPA